MSARSAVALERGADEELLDAVDDPSSSELSVQQRAALTLTDAYLTSPAAMSDAVRRQVAEHLSARQIVEVVLKLTGFSSDKVMVALGLDLDEVRIFTLD
jgi:alkylhydroperoxidase family enzyme